MTPLPTTLLIVHTITCRLLVGSGPFLNSSNSSSSYVYGHDQAVLE